MQSSFLRRLAVLAPVFLSLATCTASGCDPFPDECEDDDTVCDGNVVNRCVRPGAESRRITKREDCGPSRSCLVLADGTPVCARADGAECAMESEVSCRDDRTSTICVRAKDGRLVFVDTACGSEGRCSNKTCRTK